MTFTTAITTPVPVACDIILLGSGGHAAVIAECARRVGHTIIAVASQESITDEAVFRGAQELGDAETIGLARIQELMTLGARLVAAAGDASVRARWFTLFGEASFVTIIDPSVVISPSAIISAGVFIAPRAVINARAARLRLHREHRRNHRTRLSHRRLRPHCAERSVVRQC
jgi:acetyltransferase EpsM